MNKKLFPDNNVKIDIERLKQEMKQERFEDTNYTLPPPPPCFNDEVERSYFDDAYEQIVNDKEVNLKAYVVLLELFAMAKLNTEVRKELFSSINRYSFNKPGPKDRTIEEKIRSVDAIEKLIATGVATIDAVGDYSISKKTFENLRKELAPYKIK